MNNFLLISAKTVLHFVIGVGLSMVLGFLPAALLDSALLNPRSSLPFSPTIAIVGLILGYYLSVQIAAGKGSTFIWIPGLLWLGIALYSTAQSWSPTWAHENSRWAFALNNYFGRGSSCADSECLTFCHLSSVASLTYSLGAFIRRRRLAHK